MRLGASLTTLAATWRERVSLTVDVACQGRNGGDLLRWLLLTTIWCSVMPFTGYLPGMANAGACWSISEMQYGKMQLDGPDGLVRRGVLLSEQE